MLAKLGAERRVGPAQRVEGDSLGKRRQVFGGELRVRPLDRRIEDFGPHAVALARLLADAAGEDEVVGLGPLRGELVFAEELHKLGLKGDFAQAGGGLRDRNAEDARLQVEVPPAQVRQLRDPQAAGHDRRGKQRPVGAGHLEQRLDLRAAQPRPLRRSLLQLLDPSLDRVEREEVVAHRGVEDLPQPRQRLVDRSVRQRPLDQPLLPLADLCGLVAVGLLGGDLAEQVALEEGEEVSRQRELVVLAGARGELVAPGVEPL
ncbi:MAG TPA: hypothetical protein VGG40_12190 [Solirubrobacterales bacterium]